MLTNEATILRDDKEGFSWAYKLLGLKPKAHTRELDNIQLGRPRSPLALYKFLNSKWLYVLQNELEAQNDDQTC